MNKKLLYYINIVAFLLLSILILIIAIKRPFISDEFHEAVLVSKLRYSIPYLDVQFYKNVLGYYLKLPLLLLPFSWFDKLIVTRIVLGLFFLANLYYIVRALKNIVNIRLYSLSLVVSLFITQSLLHTSAYRVDLLNFLFGYWSLIFLLKNRLLLAGIISGVGFCISQKGAIYCVAGAVTILTMWPKNKEGVKDLARFGFGGAVVVLFYVLFWGIISDPIQVINTIFFRDAIMATEAGLSVRWYWFMSLVENFPVYLLSLIGVGIWVIRGSGNVSKIALIYSLVVLVFALCLGQPWPHWFILWGPFLSFFIYLFFITLQETSPHMPPLISIFSIFFSFCFLLFNYSFENDFQRFNLELMERFLRPGGAYLAGVDLHEDFLQKPDELSEMYAINRLKLFKESEDEKSKLLFKLDQNPPKIIVYNYRIPEFLPRIKHYIDNNYYHFFGNILSRQISISRESKSIDIPFSGNYLVSSRSENFEILVNGTLYKKGQTLSLNEGRIKLSSNGGGDLKLLPFTLNKPFPQKFLDMRSLHLTFSDKMGLRNFLKKLGI